MPTFLREYDKLAQQCSAKGVDHTRYLLRFAELALIECERREWSSPVHSAHVGQELEVHYRWHRYFGRKVSVRRVEQRATGQFLKVQGPAGTVVILAGWMLDPVICAGMTIGAPCVDLAALVELKRKRAGMTSRRSETSSPILTRSAELQARTLPARCLNRSGGRK
ncbi:MAG TPA: hypothetical protein VFE77_11825 [Rhodanobacter sp.]|nr:hypothetical protein [Rhodanobacter sp.]